jgi:zinc D-Ala-D-Ala dipeptidase
MSARPRLVLISGRSQGASVELINAGTGNFTGRVFYQQALCFLRPQAEAGLRKAVAAAQGVGLRLKLRHAAAA